MPSVEVVGESCLKSGNTVYFLKMFSGDWILFDLYDPVYYIYTTIFFTIFEILSLPVQNYNFLSLWHRWKDRDRV